MVLKKLSVYVDGQSFLKMKLEAVKTNNSVSQLLSTAVKNVLDRDIADRASLRRKYPKSKIAKRPVHHRGRPEADREKIYKKKITFYIPESLRKKLISIGCNHYRFSRSEMVDFAMEIYQQAGN